MIGLTLESYGLDRTQLSGLDFWLSPVWLHIGHPQPGGQILDTRTYGYAGWAGATKFGTISQS